MSYISNFKIKTVQNKFTVITTLPSIADKRKCERKQLRVSVKRKAAEDVTSRPASLSVQSCSLQIIRAYRQVI
jgi:hypothetical protein